MFTLKVALAVFAIAAQCLASADQRCSSCKLVAKELRGRLENERVRNSIDSRSRLNKDGKRIGKIIKFEVSELRAIELLDDLCSEMKKYTLDDQIPGHWKIRQGPETPSTRHHSRSLMSACSDIIGEHEDDLAAAIRSGKATPDSIEQMLCFTPGACDTKSEL
jgi:hypothetical protein